MFGFVRSPRAARDRGRHHSASALRTVAPRTRLAAALAAALVLAAAPAGVLSAQQGDAVGGTVVAERTGTPIPEVQVVVEGTSRGAVTDANGRFRIPGLSGDSVRLTARRIGYRQATVTARVGSDRLLVPLVERAIELNSVVITGTTGATQRRELGNAVSQIRASDIVATAPVNNVQELLNARAPGVNIIQSSGQAGAGSRIRIRGASSLSLVNEPLIYVDGVRVDNTQASGPTSQAFGSRPISRWNDFNPEDIESIEIIKGPAAATLYGTEAANGVIQIITKKGMTGKARWDLTLRQGAQWFRDPEGRIETNWGEVPDASGTGLDTASLDIVDLENSRGNKIFRTGQLQEYNLSVSGGTPLIRYYVGGALNRDEGVEETNKLKRYNGRLNLALTPSEKWDASTSLGYTTGRTNLGFESGGGGVTWTTYFATPSNLDSPTRGFYSGPPEAYTAGFEIFQDVSRFTGSVTFNHRPLRWLNQRLIVGTDRLAEDNQEIGQRNEQLAVFFSELGGAAEGGYMDVSTRDVRNNTVDYAANARFSVTPVITSTTSFGAQYFVKEIHRRNVYGEGFPAAGFKSLQSLGFREVREDDVIPNKTLGFFVQQQAGIRDRLFLTAAVRADDNSAFGANFDRAYYPKFSASWVVSEEPFFRLPFVNALKLRAAYGRSGQQPDAFASVATYLAGGNGTVTPGALGNANLGPEISNETELGFDAGFLNDRAGLEVTYFRGLTTDAILQRGVAPSTGSGGIPDINTGIGIQYFNAGRVKRNGLELLLRAQPVQTRSVALDLSFNIGTNTNKIESLGFNPDGTPITTVSIDAFNQHRVGYPVGSWFRSRVVSAQYDAATGEATNILCDDGKGGSMSCSTAPRVYLGNGTPKREGAFAGTLTFLQNFRFAALVDFKGGYKKLDGLHRVRCHLFNECRVNFFPQEFDPIYVAQVQSGTSLIDDLIRDASFTRLRELSLTYTLPERWARAVRGSRASVTVAGRNLHTWTDWPGIDPEASFNSGTRGTYAQWEQNVIPPLTSFVTTFNVSF